MRAFVLSLAAALSAFSFGAEASPRIPLNPSDHGLLVQRADYWCGPGAYLSQRGYCVRRYYRPPPPPFWGWGPPPPRWHRWDDWRYDNGRHKGWYKHKWRHRDEDDD